jgi:hypothetical protein
MGQPARCAGEPQAGEQIVLLSFTLNGAIGFAQEAFFTVLLLGIFYS